MAMDSQDAMQLVRRAAAGDGDAWRRLMARHHGSLRRMVALRLHRRLKRRVDPSDVLQESYLDAARRLGEYVRQPAMPFPHWLRFLTEQRVAEQHRRHLKAQRRNVNREIRPADAGSSRSEDFVDQLVGSFSSPSRVAMQAECEDRLQLALQSLTPTEREILSLRHFEQLSNGEAAARLGLDKSATSKRYVRALLRLKDAMVARRFDPSEV